MYTCFLIQISVLTSKPPQIMKTQFSFRPLVEQDENVSSQIRWFRKQILTQIGILEIYQNSEWACDQHPCLREGRGERRKQVCADG